MNLILWEKYSLSVDLTLFQMQNTVAEKSENG